MSTEGRQDVLFEEPIGLRLRAAREKNGLSQEQAGHQLRLPVAIIDAMEREDWSRLGAQIYVRSYLGSYLRLLGLPAELAAPVQAPAPVP
ncbi:MAG TPA: helix-turn-helix transcriptional regulator, partial [Arenimonas sp.]|nr:helix-turn-helix transcriptional regulator [Arenimonas sp.]